MESTLKENPVIALMITEEQYQLYFADINDEFEKSFELRFIDVESLKNLNLNREELSGKLNDVSGCITSWGTPTIEKEFLDLIPNLEIPLDSPFRELDNVILTPHIVGISVDSRKRIGDIVMDELNRYFTGQELLYRAKPTDLNNRA